MGRERDGDERLGKRDKLRGLTPREYYNVFS
jgi:hypothetical protein